jgi:hypothetical protein
MPLICLLLFSEILHAFRLGFGACICAFVFVFIPESCSAIHAEVRDLLSCLLWVCRIRSFSITLYSGYSDNPASYVLVSPVSSFMCHRQAYSFLVDAEDSVKALIFHAISPVA